MYIEMVDPRRGGQLVDMDPGAARELVKQGRARFINAPTPATPPLPGGYRGTPAASKPAPTHIEARATHNQAPTMTEAPATKKAKK